VSGPPRLRPEDRADFEAVLHLALNTPDIHAALLADPTGQATGRMHAQALEAADKITAAVDDEYRAYLAVRAAAQPARPPRSANGALLPALAVLTPPLAASSSAVLLVLGYALQLADAQGTLPGSLVTAGWVLALVAAASALMALAALVHTAIRQRGVPAPDGRPRTIPRDRLEQTRWTWQQALLDRGMLSYLRRRIREEASLRPTPPRTGQPTTPAPDANGSSPHTD
jgi:hypothetical protein